MLAAKARPSTLSSRLTQLGCCTALAVILLAAGGGPSQRASANNDTRTLSFHNTHTGEDITVTFRRNGRYDEAALKKLNWFLRDWRRTVEIEMEPRLFDLLWEAYKATGATEPVHVISGYRSPDTNSMLRARSNGVAEGSLHTHGQAMDFFIPDVPLAKIREVGLKMQQGGVGFYPSSGSPFVHLDTGAIRHWPRMTREQLVKVFPDERTVHVPSDGQPLAGYALALADVERQGRAPSTVSLAAARNAGAIGDDDVVTVASASGTAKPARPSAPTLLASFFGFKPGTGESETPKSNAADKTTDPAQRITTASLAAPVPVERIVPMPKTRPDATMTLASLAPAAVLPAPAYAAIPVPQSRPDATAPVATAARNLFEERGLWAPIEQTTADRANDALTTAGTRLALAYAQPVTPPPERRAAPMGHSKPSQIAAEPLAPARMADTPASVTAVRSQIGQRFDDPWMRAILITPSVRGYLTTAQMTRRDNRALASLMTKPEGTLAMAFSDDPHAGMTSVRFSGDAVVFLATATFGQRTTAALAR